MRLHEKETGRIQDVGRTDHEAEIKVGFYLTSLGFQSMLCHTAFRIMKE